MTHGWVYSTRYINRNEFHVLSFINIELSGIDILSKAFENWTAQLKSTLGDGCKTPKSPDHFDQWNHVDWDVFYEKKNVRWLISTWNWDFSFYFKTKEDAVLAKMFL